MTMFWNWFHTGPLLELHFHSTTHNMLVVEQGTPLKDGYMRMDRISRKNDRDASFSTKEKT